VVLTVFSVFLVLCVLRLVMHRVARWTMDLVNHLRAAGQQQRQLAVRVQGPYASPQPLAGSSDALVIVAGGCRLAAHLPNINSHWNSSTPLCSNMTMQGMTCTGRRQVGAQTSASRCHTSGMGCHFFPPRLACLSVPANTPPPNIVGGGGIAAALPVFQGLANAGLCKKQLPALLIWSCKTADEMGFMAPRVLAAAKALNLEVTTYLFASQAAQGAQAPSCVQASDRELQPHDSATSDVGESFINAFINAAAGTFSTCTPSQAIAAPGPGMPCLGPSRSQAANSSLSSQAPFSRPGAAQTELTGPLSQSCRTPL